MQSSHVLAPDYSQSPLVILWELTRACDLVCKHCRAEANPKASERQLSKQESLNLLKDFTRFSPDKNFFIVLTGGDPFKRLDLEEIVAFASGLELRTTLTPSGTNLVQLCRLSALKKSGLSRIAISIDGGFAKTHDAFRGVSGSFEISKHILRMAYDLGFETQMNTTLSRSNLEEFDRMAHLAISLNIALWSVFFMVPTGRAQLADALSADEMEWVFHRMARLSREVPFAIKSTAAPQYRRVCATMPGSKNPLHGGASRPKGVNDGNGLIFISHTGDIYPSGFLPFSTGNVRTDDVVEVYRHSAHFKNLRNPDLLKGKCGACEFKRMCGGSRARAFGLYGDYLASDPFCAHIPKGWQDRAGVAIRQQDVLIVPQ